MINLKGRLQRLENPEELDKVIAAVPGLQSNPAAIAFISKPELLAQMDDPKVCSEVSLVLL